MGLYEKLTDRKSVAFNPKKEVERRKGFHYTEGVRIEIGDTVYLSNDRDAGKFKVRALNPNGMRVLISKPNDVRTVEPCELEFIHRK